MTTSIHKKITGNRFSISLVCVISLFVLMTSGSAATTLVYASHHSSSSSDTGSSSSTPSTSGTSSSGSSSKKTAQSDGSSSSITSSDIAKMTVKPAAYIYHCNQTSETQIDINNATAVFTSKPVGNSPGLNSSTTYICVVTTTMSQKDRENTANFLQGLANGLGD